MSERFFLQNLLSSDSLLAKIKDSRREGDENSQSGFAAEKMKLLGNLSYLYQIFDRA